MARSPLFDRIGRALRIALAAEAHGIPTREALDMARAAEARRAALRRSRREFLAEAGKVAAAGALATVAGSFQTVFGAGKGKGKTPSVSVGIVGAGLAGLACADALTAEGIVPSVYEAGSRVGGRQWSLRGFFPGQVAERGGELIDNLHKTMIGYASRFGLELEDLSKEEGEVAYFFQGQHFAEEVVVDEYRDFVAAMRGDLQRLSNEVSAIAPTADDIALDNTSLAAYLDGANSRGMAAAPVVRAAILASYEAEYGLSIDRQSSINFLHFIHADKRSKFTPFGVFSDERYHVIGGNDAIANGLAGDLEQPVSLGMKLVKAKKTAAGAIELTFKQGSKTVTKTHDAVVFAIPFTTLREVELDASLGLSPEKRNAIATLGYGTNAKTMVGFTARPWAPASNGASYSDLPNHQATWETNHANATAARAILTDYSSAARGAAVDPSKLQQQVGAFLTDLDKVYPGAKAAAREADGKYVAHAEPWPKNPLTKGSYTCYMPGQFTTVAGHEGTSEGNVHFAGEHADSFYSWQGFMEGACLSGLSAASKILAAVK